MDEDRDHEEPLAECREPTLEDLVELCGWLNAEKAKYVVVGGFAIRAAGYNRRTMDVDLLIETTAENEAAVFRAISNMPDKAIAEAKVGEVDQYGVLRVADDYMIDLMKSGCGVDYAQAIMNADIRDIMGTAVPFASPVTLWKMKQTIREKDVPDRIFLQKWAEEHQVQLDPPLPSPPTLPKSSWLVRLINFLFLRKR